MNKLKAVDSIQYSTKVYASYALGSFFDDFLATALSFLVFKFYETEVFLDLPLLTAVIIIYGIWNMFNDPFAGYILNRNIKYMKRFGKRFNWFLITGIPCSIIFF